MRFKCWWVQDPRSLFERTDTNNFSFQSEQSVKSKCVMQRRPSVLLIVIVSKVNCIHTYTCMWLHAIITNNCQLIMPTAFQLRRFFDLIMWNKKNLHHFIERSHTLNVIIVSIVSSLCHTFIVANLRHNLIVKKV